MELEESHWKTQEKVGVKEKRIIDLVRVQMHPCLFGLTKSCCLDHWEKGLK